MYENKKRQGCTTQKSGLGMHQNPHFQIKTNEQFENPKINPRSTIEINTYLSDSMVVQKM